MTREEIESCLKVARDREVCVSRGPAPGIAGYVRTIRIHAESRVQVAYDLQGHEDGGAYFWATYASLEEAIAALEDFLGAPMAAWSLEDPPPRTCAPDHRALVDAIREGALAFPHGPPFRLKSCYWEQFLSRPE